MSARPLPASTPAPQGVDAAGIHAFLDAVEAAPDIEPHSLMILRHGHLVASGWWAPYTPDRRHLLYSLSKSFTSTAAGFAVAEGLLRLDDPVISYFPEFEADITDPRSRAMLVRHVASMASGHLEETYATSIRRDRDEIVRGFLLFPPDRDPGTVFAYNQPCTYTLAAIIQRVSGQSLTEYLRPRLFDPLGIGETAWLQRPPGRDLGFSGLHATTDAIARLGQFYLQDGVWEGRRLLPSSWIAEATRAHISTADGTQEGALSDWQQGYGYQFWRSRHGHGYRGDGAYGQYCLVLPEHDAVIATTAATEDMQGLLNLVWRHLLPAFGAEPLPGAADEGVRRRLAELALPPVEASPEPPARGDDWKSVVFAPEDGECPQQRTLTGVTVSADADGKGWGVSLAEDDELIELRLGATGWTVAVDGPPTAVSGGWTDQDTLRLDVLFLETPHRLTVTCSLPDGTFTVRWHTTPIHGGRLRSLRAPVGDRL
ncbi:CubicO group peptidase, beta-lactamase class C family [Streptomyces sp. OV198]|uniref:serine hydrolase domain-containing protein n=1 Tax=Streptomyces sp. OV198 TaxID=1882787 RepID=UPI000BCF446A|nr:serine hydrolase domain-containing protein [Streptomyces sp. OV198]SOF03382.1 CubicO group peptidase, beta-lactamase class C family [Streptomyces sp. OV198]